MDYNAKRLAVTSINHAYYSAAIMTGRENPFAVGIQWELSSFHVIYDVCDLYMEHDEGLGLGVYSFDNAPIPHPFCRCNWYVTEGERSLEDIAKELYRWEQGESNPRLDRAFGEWEDARVSINSPRNPAQGNPDAIRSKNFGKAYLSTRQKKLDNALPTVHSSITVGKSEASMKDIRALTAANGCEYALFTRGSQRMIVRGDAHSVDIGGLQGAAEMNLRGWRWSAHTHPGENFTMVVSKGDVLILKQFDQKRSVVYNVHNEYQVFEKGG